MECAECAEIACTNKRQLLVWDGSECECGEMPGCEVADMAVSCRNKKTMTSVQPDEVDEMGD